MGSSKSRTNRTDLRNREQKRVLSITSPFFYLRDMLSMTRASLSNLVKHIKPRFLVLYHGGQWNHYKERWKKGPMTKTTYLLSNGACDNVVPVFSPVRASVSHQLLCHLEDPFCNCTVHRTFLRHRIIRASP